MSIPPLAPPYRPLAELRLADLESIRLILRGGSVIDWQRLAFHADEDVREFLAVHEYDLDDAASRARTEAVKNAAITYLRRNYDFPIPKPVANMDVAELCLLASTKGHRQLCACTILKVMHIIHHLEARELLYMLPISDQDVFHLVEQKVYRVIGGMLAAGLPILEFIGGRKNRDSLYSKLLSKRETHAAQIYDKLRFRIVTRTPEDIFPVLGYLTRHLFAFNYVVPGQTTNTMFHLRRYCASQPRLAELARELQPVGDEEEDRPIVDNQFTAATYRVVHFVADMPVRVPQEILDAAPPAAWALGRVVFAQAEFQVIDRETEHANEMGEASHDAYKDRQKLAVMRRLKLGNAPPAAAPAPASPPRPEPVRRVV
ncbi:MAG: TIGR04552 family protein, partial [Myxococcota bacterium]|nr:TIGR04552 family protein [Myxococcota bacterium]